MARHNDEGGRGAELNVPELLDAWRAGDEAAAEALLPLVYRELHGLASSKMRGERAGHTLQATALVNEAFMRMVGLELSVTDRSHFLALAAETMRRVLIDHARAKRTHKRDAGVQVTLDDAHSIGDARDVDVIDLDAALVELEELDARKARIVELTFFGGLSAPEVAEAVQVSVATVERDLRFAKAWLSKRLQ